MIGNPEKFQVIIIDRKKGDHTDGNIVVDNKQIENVGWIFGNSVRW